MTDVRFAGVQFPSLLHAQWALFLEDLFVPWDFRPASFLLAGDQPYRPDFWLPRHRFWFQVGAERWTDGDLRDWEHFAAAATASLCKVGKTFRLGVRCTIHDARHTAALLPAEWQAEQAIYAGGPLPAPELMGCSGPVDRREDGEFMRVVGDSGYQWCRCPDCATVGVEHAGRASRLGCGHLDTASDDKCADDPVVVAAYRMARLAVPAQLDGSCARCLSRFILGDLIAAGRKIGKRRWYHAECLLQARRSQRENASTAPQLILNKT